MNPRSTFTVEVGGATSREIPRDLPAIVLLLQQAERFREMVEGAEVASRAEIARLFRLTRARVTQVMKLLNLDPLLLAYIRSLPPGTPTRLVTERGLRGLVDLPRDQQLRHAPRVVRGFSAYTAGGVSVPAVRAGRTVSPSSSSIH